MPFLSLPFEIIKMIASELPDEDVLDLMCTNRQLHDLLIRDLYKRTIDTDPSGYALFCLHLAVEDDNLLMANLLLETGANVNAEYESRAPFDSARSLTPLDVDCIMFQSSTAATQVQSKWYEQQYGCPDANRQIVK
ncbi:hypothetical protein N7517_001563 [Penicillium concentricum]|uniref:F-box domain-containing protein n=1 Tax=Penicillium concentricum TaxID=293559 RepID=A0A9W9VIZ3_9EURO|nr:uncharacterized protein N7517_001563 [Penicillium concentricum]KAJ5383652.1 hypothetical protein N7517_001563 [Penicillium concentricum]